MRLSISSARTESRSRPVRSSPCATSLCSRRTPRRTAPTASPPASATLAEAYVTKGAPNQAALKPTGKALEIQALTHPNSITAGTEAEFVLLFEGKPLSGAELTLFRSAGFYDGRKVAAQVKSDTAGRFKLKPQDAGTYLILVRHRGEAPAGAETPFRSYTYTLAFDAA
jgi:uncharacterized GH25 family protein